MANAYTVDDLLDFLEHAGDRGLIPAATAQALAVASRNVLGVLNDQERAYLAKLDIDSVIRRFTNKRKHDFTPASLKEYGRRVHRALELFLKWREDPTNFTIKTRGTTASRKKGKAAESTAPAEQMSAPSESSSRQYSGTYQSAVPVRGGLVVTISNVPRDLTEAEAERIANFVRMLAVIP